MNMTNAETPLETLFAFPSDNLQQNLILRATARRSLHLLAMAFRLHKPRWGSQSLLIAYGLANYLSYYDWDLRNVEYSIPEYLDASVPSPGRNLTTLRLTQLRHLTELVTEAPPVTLRPADTSERSRLLTAFANNGCLLHDLRQAATAELSPDAYVRLVPLITSLTPESYVAAVHPEDRALHPQALDERICSYERKVQAVAQQYAQNSPSPIPRTAMRA